MRPIIRITCITAMAALGSCSKSENAKVDTTTPQPPVASAPANASAASDTMVTIRGTIATVSSNQLVVTTDSGPKTIKLTQPVKVYARGPSSLANVKDNTFIGVTTVKQPDGSEQATEIHIFPEALRGLGEGSRMMAPSAAGGSANNRMTNGSVSGATTGAQAGARMSNGNVTKSTGSTMIVQYAVGSQSVTVPANTPVTEIKETSKTLAVGDKVAVIGTRAADGTLSANRVLLAGK